MLPSLLSQPPVTAANLFLIVCKVRQPDLINTTIKEQG